MANNPNAADNLKPFTKGDKRINRDGRPKNSVELGALFRRIGAEIVMAKDGKPVLGPDGKPMTVVEAIARQKAQDKRYQEEFLIRAFGRVPQAVEMTGADGGPIQTQQVPIDLDKLSEDDVRMILAIQAKAAVVP